MARFYHEKKQHNHRRALISAAVFFVILFVFFYGITNLSGGNTKRQKESLENALNRTITYCYAVEGAYPESLDYMKEHYALTYDEKLFFVDYQVMASNLFPDVTIIELKEGQP